MIASGCLRLLRALALSLGAAWGAAWLTMAVLGAAELAAPAAQALSAD